ncbi:SRPBCC family protein [Flavobacterium urumqiense]|uniref:Polyketide cyclase / dehydrase and lipid transport n=1 Tax=Flavobacterium urumqiense TaxID=935224 RepID=A0A1H5ZQU1_9FLAO|nr:SRPBCC family protein [Flavobacterium urumqiense]SEG38125.1 Polyketide cyclase / dehydrase and lipid transport [Flavobacterium urumqiense]
MKILKYLFLLLLLSLVALSIFVATQKGDFTVERSKVINSPKSAVFNYVNDYKNWADFGSWTAQDPEMKINYPQNTIGKGASYSWEGKEGNGSMKTIFVKENDSIAQKMNFEGTASTVFWSFKDTVGGTKVTWKTTGKMSFLFKIYTAFNGGVNKVIGSMYEKSLANLDKILDYEINTYTVKVNGLIKMPETFYLHQTFTSEISKVIKNFRIVTPKIITFCEKNNLPLAGKPFVIYHTYDLVNGLTKISICVPIKNQIYTSEGSDLLTGKLEAFEAVKTTLTGDYSHIIKAMDITNAYIASRQIAINPSLSHIEVYTAGKTETKSPSKWVTEIYYPTKPTLVANPINAVPNKTAIIPNTTAILAPKTDIVVPKARLEVIVPKTKTDVVVPKAKKDAVIPKAKKTVPTPVKEVEIPSEF